MSSSLIRPVPTVSDFGEVRIGSRFLKSNSDFFDFRRGDCRKIGGISDNLCLGNRKSQNWFYSAIRVESLWGRFSYGGNKHSVILQSGCACAPGLTRPPSPCVRTAEPHSGTGADLGSEFPSPTGTQVIR